MAKIEIKHDADEPKDESKAVTTPEAPKEAEPKKVTAIKITHDQSADEPPKTPPKKGNVEEKSDKTATTEDSQESIAVTAPPSEESIEEAPAEPLVDTAKTD